MRIPPALWLLLAALPALAGPPTDPRLDAVRARALELVESDGVPSLSIAVAVGGEIVWEESFGWADIENRIPATPETIYPVASLTKSITGTAILLLVERGLVDLDAPLARYLPDAAASRATVRQTLNMTAAIPHGWYCPELSAPQRFLSTGDLVRRFAFSAFPPGVDEDYSNFSYLVPEAIIERVSGRDYAAFLQGEIFAPLGMTHSAVTPGPGLSSSMAVKYGEDLSTRPPILFQPRGAAGCHSSARDLIRYGMFQLKHPVEGQQKILSDAALDRMHTEIDPGVPGSIMALGWGSLDLGDGMRLFISNGGIQGAGSSLVLVPGADVAAVCLTNSDRRNDLADEIALQIAAAFVPGLLEKMAGFRERYEASRSSNPYTADATLLGRWTGRIDLNGASFPLALTFQSDGDIHIRVGEQYATLLDEVTVRGGRIRGWFYSSLLRSMGSEHPDEAMLEIARDGDRLVGFVRAYRSDDTGGYALPGAVVLEREAGPAGAEPQVLRDP